MTRRSLSRSAGAALAALAIFAGTAAAQAPPAPSIGVDTAFAPPSGVSKFDFTPGTAADVAGGVAVYGDRIYTVGETRDSTGDADIGITARLPDGRFDTGFSGDGKETIRVAVNEGSNKGRDAGFAVVVLPDGRLRIAAAIDVDATSAINLDVAVVGVLANGGLDPSFGGGDGWLSFPVGTVNDTPTRMALDPVTGRIAVTGTTVNSAKDDFFVALVEPAGTLAPFGTGGSTTYNRGGVAGASVSLNDRGTDVMFKPGGGILALLQVETDPDANINGWQAVLHSFADSGADDTGFSGDGDMVLTVGDPDTIPGGMTSYEDRIWVTGSTKTGQDTDAFLARLNADGGDLQSRRFDMRGNTVAPEQAVTSQGNDVAVVPGVPPTLVVGGFMTGDAGTDWAAAAFNDLTAGVGSFGSDDTVMATPGQGTIVGVAPGSGQWAAAGGSLLDLNSADTSFGTARLMIDADKECDLALEILRPLEISITWGQPLPLLLRVTNVGTRSCDGAISVPAPYALSRGGATGALAVGNLAAGAATTLDGVLLSYGGARLRSDTMSFTVAAPADGNTANNVRTVRVSFGFCDLRLQSEGGATIPNEGPRRFEVEVRNGGTSPCRGLQLDVASGGRLLARGDSYTLPAGRSASDTIAVGSPRRAKLGSRLSIVLRASAPGDADPGNDTVTVRPLVVGVGDSSIRSAGSRRLSGSASGGRGKLSRAAKRVARVQVAIQRVRGKSCRSLASRSGRRFVGSSCSRKRWLRATGTRSWRLTLSKSLPPGRYVAYSRATIRAGFHEGEFSAADRNKRAFTVG